MAITQQIDNQVQEVKVPEYHIGTPCGSMCGEIQGPPKHWPVHIENLSLDSDHPHMCSGCREAKTLQSNR